MDYRCTCGGIMEQKVRHNVKTQQHEVWYVCPFCQTQRPAKDAAPAQGVDDGQDRVLTQAR